MTRQDQIDSANMCRMADAMESMAKSMEKLANPAAVIDPLLKPAKTYEEAVKEHDVAMFSSQPKPRYRNIHNYAIDNMVEDTVTGEKLSLQEAIDRLNENAD